MAEVVRNALTEPKIKQKILAEFKDKYVEGRFEDEVNRIYERLNENKEKIRESLLSQFKEVCKKAAGLQERNLKGNIKYIYISYLRSSLLEDKALYRIDLYDEKWFLDKAECTVDIDLNFIFEPLFRHINELQEKKKEYGRAINEMDVEKIKLKEGNKYHNLALDVLEEFVDDFLNCSEYIAKNKEDEISIFAGEFMDEVRLLYKGSKEN